MSRIPLVIVVRAKSRSSKLIKCAKLMKIPGCSGYMLVVARDSNKAIGILVRKPSYLAGIIRKWTVFNLCTGGCAMKRYAIQL